LCPTGPHGIASPETPLLMWEPIASVLYTLCSGLFVLCVFGLVLHAVSNAYLYWLHRFRYTKPLQAPSHYSSDELPFNIIQLPVFNEDIATVQRLLTSACGLDYPRERLLIQLLDDSDDPTISEALGHCIVAVRASHPDIDLSYHHRSERRAYKAGNLNAGLSIAKQTLRQKGYIDASRIIVSVFDADFIIPADYLNHTVHYFLSPSVGAVQALLEFDNQNLNVITQAQALFMINLHRVDFGTRSRSGHFTTFLGSAGSWRLQAIEAAGGWQGDTQVEDVDLSVAAQLTGWRILFLEPVRVACQLPANVIAFKLQQRSWMKGFMEVFRKWRGSIWAASHLTVWKKAMAFDFMLILPFQALFVILGHLLIIPTYLFIKSFGYTQWLGELFFGLLILFSLTHFPMLVASVGRRSKSSPNTTAGFRETLWKRATAFGLIPSLFPALTYGLVEGLLGVKVHRDRTVRSADTESPQPLGISVSQKKILVRIFIFEFVMSLYGLGFVIWAAHEGQWGVGGLLGILVFLYAGSAWITMKHLLSRPTGRS
jgi:cellulose synthase/poly-beta-1,6-N-acetylglucosamine synthase-like glycosyltransferase